MRLNAEGLSKSYGETKALSGVSFELTEGIYGLLGPNGSGKSTLINILTGNLAPQTGKVEFEGEDIREMGINYRRILGYVPQKQALYADFSAERFLFYMSALNGIKTKAAKPSVKEVLREVGLSEVRHDKIKTFSGGMKQRLLIAQSLLNNPRVLIMDEPSVGLDPKQRVLIRNLLKSMAADRIILISTHVVSDVENIADKMMLLKKGRLIGMGTARNMIAYYCRRKKMAFSEKVGMEDVYLHFFGEHYDETDIL